MSVHVLLEVNVKPESVDDMNALMKEIMPDTRAYDGCEGITVQSNADDPSNVVILEQWQSREHHEKYLAWRTETGVMGKIGAMLTGEPSIRYFNVVDV